MVIGLDALCLYMGLYLTLLCPNTYIVTFEKVCDKQPLVVPAFM